MLDVTKLSGVYMTVSEVSEYVPITAGRVAQMLRAGDLRGIKVSPKLWLIHKDEADRVKNMKHNCGRPRVHRGTR